MAHFHILLPDGQTIQANRGDTLLSVLRDHGCAPEAPCGGEGRCGKCLVIVNGKEALACQTAVDCDMTVALPKQANAAILTASSPLPEMPGKIREGYLLAVDIGTTTVVAYLLDAAAGTELCCAGARNPQIPFGADVVTRIRHGVQGHMAELTQALRGCLEALTRQLCEKAGIFPGEILQISMAANPAMQQFALGIPVNNLAGVPFAPVLTQFQRIPASSILPLWKNAQLLIIPNIAGFIGTDTVACILSARQDKNEEISLLVDIGTNGEMVLGSRDRLIACSAAAGPALEGAGIQCGMSAQDGAIDHVWLDGQHLKYHVIGGGSPTGLCGSGLIDAVAAALELGLLNERGKILADAGVIPISEGVFLTQDDIRQVQLAKGAIAAGIHLLAIEMDIALEDIPCVYLAGAFGTYLDPDAACRIGLLPQELRGRIQAIGNAAGSGAKLLACSREAQARAQRIAENTEVLELSTAPSFPGYFSRCMRF